MHGGIQATVAGVLRELSVPVFFAGVDTRHTRLSLHVHAGCNTEQLKAQAESAMARAGESLEVTVHTHRLGQLAFPRSLEGWLARFRVGQVVLHDPTMIVSHARRLVASVKSCRSALGDAIAGSFFDPDRRTLFILARNSAEARALQAKAAALVAGADDAGDRSAQASSSLPHMSVRVVGELPRRGLVPVDAKSASLSRRIARALRRWLAPAAVVLAMGGTPAAASAGLGPEGGPPVTFAAQSHAAFGVLSGLSVFAGGSRHDTFATMTLEWFFVGTAQGPASQGPQLADSRTNCLDAKAKTGDCTIFYTGS